MQPGKVHWNNVLSLTHLEILGRTALEDRAVRETACSWLEVTTRSSSKTVSAPRAAVPQHLNLRAAVGILDETAPC